MSNSPGKLMAIGVARLGSNVSRQAVLARYEPYLVAGLSHDSVINQTLADIFTREPYFGDPTALAAAFAQPAYADPNADARNAHVEWHRATLVSSHNPIGVAADRLGPSPTSILGSAEV